MVKNASHTLAYSIVGLQELNLAYRFPIIYWNCACLITDAGGMPEENEDDDEEESDEDEEEDNDNKKKKASSTDYGKISTAIGKIKTAGVIVEPPDINKSDITFSPDAEQNVIRFGLSGIVKVGRKVVKEIVKNRPYNNIEDFLSKNKINKAQMINLIKCGAFDNLYKNNYSRIEIMDKYIRSISDQKKRITLQNMKMLIDFNLIPAEYDDVIKIYNFNKYLKKFKNETFYDLDNIAFNFYEKHFDIDKLFQTESESGFSVKQTYWDTIYKKSMDKIRPYVQNNNATLLKKVNDKLISDAWNKDCLGTISKWEMDSVCCYFHEHELVNVVDDYYNFSDFSKLPEEPNIDRYIYIKGKEVPLFKIYRIMGTVLDKDKNKHTITLLTKTGVVTVSIFGNVFTNYDKQISQKGADGHKHVIEKSWFQRGNKLIITGIRRDNQFVAKKYSRTPYHLVELITDIDDGIITTVGERSQEE